MSIKILNSKLTDLVENGGDLTKSIELKLDYKSKGF